MTTLSEHHNHYQTIKRVIEWLSDNYLSQPRLDDIAQAVGMSPYHLQRTFKQWAGVTPKEFIGYLTKEHAKSKLKDNTVMEAALSSGLSGSSRLYDLMIGYDAVTPGEFKSQGEGLLIQYGIHLTPFGYCLLATTSRGICHLSFFDDHSDCEHHISELQSAWSEATLVNNTEITTKLVMHIFGDQTRSTELKLLLKGSPFKRKVWEALLTIPLGSLQSYQQVAVGIGKPSATRAVASAIASNPIAYLIPCHRVIRNSGEFNAYRWGRVRKAALIGWENSHQV